MKILIYFIITLGLINCSQGLATDEPSKTPALSEQLEETTEEPINSLKTQVFTFDQIKAMTPSEITIRIGKDKSIPHFKDFENWPLYELNTQQLGRLFYQIILHGYLGNVTPEQIHSIRPESINRIDYIIRCLSPEQTKAMTPKQISRVWTFDFTPEQVAQLNASQINSLSSNDLTAEKVHVISPETITEIGHYSIPFDRLTRAQVEAVTPEQISYVDEYGLPGDGISKFTVEQIPWLTPEQISAHPIEVIQFLKPEQLAAMSHEQLQAISIEKSYEFKDRHLRALSFSQLLLFEENHKIDTIIGFSANGRQFFQQTNPKDYPQYEYYMQFIFPNDFKHVSYTQALSFSHNLLAVLSPERIKWMPYYAKVLTPQLIQKDATEPDKWLITKEQFQAIPVEQIPDLSLEFLEAMTNEQVYWFTFEQLAHLNRDQLKRLFTSGFSERPPMHVPKVFSIIHIAEQTEEGDEWLRGPMKEVIMEHMEIECAQFYGCRERWMKFPDLPQSMKDSYFSPPPQPEEPILTYLPHLIDCQQLSNLITNSKNRSK
ncbi:MAG: hypothetical protein OXK80_02630 [Bdellovibrionales bacterium]|nr:hypothetical protein [Bdellovibrionales bacterium]